MGISHAYTELTGHSTYPNQVRISLEEWEEVIYKKFRTQLVSDKIYTGEERKVIIENFIQNSVKDTLPKYLGTVDYKYKIREVRRKLGDIVDSKKTTYKRTIKRIKQEYNNILALEHYEKNKEFIDVGSNHD